MAAVVSSSMSPAFPLSWSSELLPGSSTVLVAVAGELDRHTAPALRDHVAWRLSGDCERLVLDTTAVTFADVGAFDLLSAIGELALTRGARVVVTSPGAAVTRLLEVIGPVRGVDLEQW